MVQKIHGMCFRNILTLTRMDGVTSGMSLTRKLELEFEFEQNIGKINDTDQK